MRGGWLWVLAPIFGALWFGCAAGEGVRDAGIGFDVPPRDSGDRTDSGEGEDGGDPRDAGPLPDGGGRVCDAEETCYDGLDNDCDDAVDEICACDPGETGACYRGEAGTRGVGACRDGAMLCTGSFEFGEWGPCEGDLLPSGEVCDVAGVDEDCDGAANEGCECFDGDPPLLCGTDEGECVAGLQRCVEGARTDCEGSVGPDVERCDGLDNDCDGSTDEGVRRSCGSSMGTCTMGTQLCTDGVWGECAGGRVPIEEVCDGLDNDCDSSTDEFVTQSCGITEGRCLAGVETCVGGMFGACEGRVDPIGETCNGVDDDCDGTTDESLSRVCGMTDVGACAFGAEVCDGGTYGACVGAILPEMERCEGSVDEDCDGNVDEGCGCTEGMTRPCGDDTGECVAGTETCSALGTWGACVGAVGMSPEACDALDNDCDGRVDEGLTMTCGVSDVGACALGTRTCSAGAYGACVGRVDPSTELCEGSSDEDCDGATDEGCGCTAGMTRPCGSDVGACSAGSQSCDVSGTWGSCMGATGPSGETCDGVLDEDCDGATDEGCECTTGVTRPCGSDVGECMAGTETCDAAGRWGACLGSVGGSAETCDGRDQDCDGLVDEALSRTCGSAVGECMTGTQTCSVGTWGSCVGEVRPSPDRCDGVMDEDCDGLIDEGCLCTDGQTRSCGTDTGECVAGIETCDLSGAYGPCVGATGPRAESCDGRDEDCDASTDEGGVCLPPTVMCPGSQSTTVGTAVTLSGSGSDPDGGGVSFAWTVVSAPVGSSALPSPSTAASTSFTPDVPGGYTLRLCVTDDEGAVSCCTAAVTAMSTCTPPTAPSVVSCGTSWDRRPVVEFTPLPSGVTYALYKDADAAPYANVTTVGQNYHRPSAPLGAGGPPPGTTMDIYAVACRSSDPSCCSVSATTTVRLVADCLTPIAPTSTNLIFSEYVANGDGPCAGPDCEAGEAIEITNLSHCPVRLDGYHFAYCNPSSCGTYRWMDFGPTDVVPPRGVYVAIRNQAASMCSYPFFGPDDPGLFGLKISTLDMQGSGLSSGWFANGGGGMSQLRVASGMFVDMTTGTTIDLIAPYSGSAGECSSIGFNAYDACGEISAVSTPTDVLTPNQLGRLWHPCDAVVSPMPASCL